MAPRTFSATSGSERLGRWTIAGLVVVPLVVGGILSWALTAPTTQLDRVTAAIVNDDDPITLNGQTVPLGREFAAGLIAGEAPSTDDAPPPTTPSPTGQADTAAAAAPAQPAESSDADDGVPDFTWILTNADDAASGLRSGRYAAVVTIPSDFSASATSFSGPASDARQAVIEVATTPASAFLDPALTAAVTQAATASLNRQLISQYLGQVYDGFNQINASIGQAASGAESLASGAASLADGTASLADGAAALATGAEQLAAGLGPLDAGAATLSAGLGELSAAVQSLPGETAALARGANGVAAAIDAAASAVSGATARMAAVVAEVCRLPDPGPVCDRARAALARLESADDQVARLAAGADAVAAGNDALAAAMPGLVSGVDASATGAAELAAGAAEADAGAAGLALGADELASGAQQADAGAAQLSDGATQLADGLAEAVDEIPTYTDDDIATLSTVVSQPVLAEQDAVTPGVPTAPLFTVLALWLGGLAIALARQAVPSRLLLTAATSWSIAWRSMLPTAALGAAQGSVAGIVVLGSVTVDALAGLAFAGSSILIGAVFAIANQGLAAAFGGAGRLVALGIALIALSAGLSSTVPPILASVAALLPTAPAATLLRAALTSDPGAAWASLAFLAVVIASSALLVYAGVASRRRLRPTAVATTPA